MRFYRTALYSEADGHGGYKWFTSQRDADRFKADVARENDGIEVTKIEPIDITATRAGILKALNDYAGHPDNG